MWRLAVDFAQCPARGRRVVAYGTNGQGKSRVCRALWRWIRDRAIDLPLVMHNNNPSLCTCELAWWPSCVDRFKDTQDWSIEDFLDADLLLIDDLGAEHDPTRAGLSKMYQILEERENRWTWITTNIAPESWEERFERRIADRLFRNCEHVDLSQLPSYAVSH